MLKLYDIKGVILNNQNWYLDNLWLKEILKEDCFINLIEKTNYFEANEIVKNTNARTRFINGPPIMTVSFFGTLNL